MNDYKIKIKGTYHLDRDSEQYFYYEIYKEDKLINSGIESIDYNSIDFTDESQENNLYANFIKENLSWILHKPLLQEQSELVKYCFDGSEKSESGMYFVETDEWENLLECDYFTESDIEKLENDIKQLKLEDTVEFDNNDAKITIYQGFVTMFNTIKSL